MKECFDCGNSFEKLTEIFDKEVCSECLEEISKQIDDGGICPQCGGDEFHTKRTYEFADADGNRGVWINYPICKNCGYEG